MRESLTLFVAVALCLLLCLPAKSLDKFWQTFGHPFSEMVNAAITFPATLSINFKFDDPFFTPLVLQLVPQRSPNEYKIDWSFTDTTSSFLEIYDTSGKLLKKVGSISKDTESTSISLESGIYYASIVQNNSTNTQKGYAKFVVK